MGSWSDDLSLNIESIDTQHKKLVDMLDALFDSMSKKESNETLSKIIEGLIQYTGTHFKYEEDLFEKYNYPGRQHHIDEHAQFVKKVTDFEREFKNGSTMLTTDVFYFLKDWVKKHIQDTDKKYVSYLIEKGVK